MATLKIIGHKGHRITPRGAGWEVDGLFFATWSAAVVHCREGQIPTEEEVLQREDADLSLHISREEDTYFMRSEKAMRLVVFAAALLLSLMMASCSMNETPARMATTPHEVPLVTKIVGATVIICGLISIIAAVAYSRGRTYHNRMEERAWKTRQYPSATTKRNHQSVFRV